LVRSKNGHWPPPDRGWDGTTTSALPSLTPLTLSALLLWSRCNLKRPSVPECSTRTQRREPDRDTSSARAICGETVVGPRHKQTGAVPLCPLLPAAHMSRH